LLEHRPGPTFGGGCLLYRIAVTVFTVGRQCISHMQVSVGQAALAVHFDAIFHATAPGPAILHYPLGAVLKIHNAQALVLSFGFVCMDVRAHMAEYAGDFWPAKKPPTKRNPMTPHVHKHSATGAGDVPKPRGMRAK